MDKSKVDATYRRLRLQVFIGIFVGYAGYYLLRTFPFRWAYMQAPSQSGNPVL